jgi:predicted nucleotidyltransferase
VEVYHPWRLYLFGSTARGDAGPDSDYDFMVVVPDDAPLKLKDILVWKRSEVEEGKLLYAA